MASLCLGASSFCRDLGGGGDFACPGLGCSWATAFLAGVALGYTKDTSLLAWRNDVSITCLGWQQQNGLWYYHGALVTPNFMGYDQRYLHITTIRPLVPTSRRSVLGVLCYATQRWYWWPRLTNDVATYLQTCTGQQYGHAQGHAATVGKSC